MNLFLFSQRYAPFNTMLIVAGNLSEAKKIASKTQEWSNNAEVSLICAAFTNKPGVVVGLIVKRDNDDISSK